MKGLLVYSCLWFQPPLDCRPSTRDLTTDIGNQPALRMYNILQVLQRERVSMVYLLVIGLYYLSIFVSPLAPVVWWQLLPHTRIFLFRKDRLKDNQFKCVYLLKPVIQGYGVNKQNLLGGGDRPGMIYIVTFKFSPFALLSLAPNAVLFMPRQQLKWSSWFSSLFECTFTVHVYIYWCSTIFGAHLFSSLQYTLINRTYQPDTFFISCR